MKFDALGNEVIMGQTYGYTTDSSGITESVVGIAIKETKQGVSIKISEKRIGLWGNDSKLQVGEVGKTTNVKSMKLWPVKIIEN